MKRILWVLVSVSVLVSCTHQPKEIGFVEQVEEAHQKGQFLSHKAIRFDIKLSFGGKERLNGQISTLTGSGKGVIDFEDGRKIYQVNDKVFYSPEFESTKGIRFDAYTWSYFFLFPYKLSDEGTVWSDYPQTTLNGEKFLTQKLTFDQGVGDAPDDWYIVYASEKEKYIEVAAYIVTAHKSLKEAEKDPHAIKYEDYRVVEGVPVATKWSFWGWDASKGLTEKLGEATLSNIEFFTPQQGYFHPPLEFEEI